MTAKSTTIFKSVYWHGATGDGCLHNAKKITDYAFLESAKRLYKPYTSVDAPPRNLSVLCTCAGTAHNIRYDIFGTVVHNDCPVSKHVRRTFALLNPKALTCDVAISLRSDRRATDVRVARKNLHAVSSYDFPYLEKRLRDAARAVIAQHPTVRRYEDFNYSALTNASIHLNVFLSMLVHCVPHKENLAFGRWNTKWPINYFALAPYSPAWDQAVCAHQKDFVFALAFFLAHPLPLTDVIEEQRQAWADCVTALMYFVWRTNWQDVAAFSSDSLWRRWRLWKAGDSAYQI